MIKQLLGLGLGAVIGGSVVAGTLGNQMDSLKQENTEIRLELDTEKDKSSKLQLSLEEALADVSYNQTLVTQLTSDLETKTTALNTALAEKESISAELAEVELALETSQGNLTELQARYDELSANYETAQETITSLQSSKTNLHAQISQLNAEITRLNNLIAEYEYQLLIPASASDFICIDSVITDYVGTDTEIIIPKTYSIDGTKTYTKTIRNVGQLVPFCHKYNYFNFFLGSIRITSIEDIASNINTIQTYLTSNPQDFTIEVPNIIDGTDYEFTTIGMSVFEYNSNLTEVVLPSSIKTIEAQAFYYCNNLKSINLESVEHINTNAFYTCSSLKKLELNNVEEIGDSAFTACHGLEEVILLKENIIAGVGAFTSCENLTKITFGDLKTLTCSNPMFSFGDSDTSSIKVDFTNCTTVPTISGKIFSNSFGGIIQLTGLLYDEWTTSDYWSAYSNAYFELNVLIEEE